MTGPLSCLARPASICRKAHQIAAQLRVTSPFINSHTGHIKTIPSTMWSLSIFEKQTCIRRLSKLCWSCLSLFVKKYCTQDNPIPKIWGGQTANCFTSSGYKYQGILNSTFTRAQGMTHLLWPSMAKLRQRLFLLASVWSGGSKAVIRNQTARSWSHKTSMCSCVLHILHTQILVLLPCPVRKVECQAALVSFYGS